MKVKDQWSKWPSNDWTSMSEHSDINAWHHDFESTKWINYRDKSLTIIRYVFLTVFISMFPNVPQSCNSKEIYQCIIIFFTNIQYIIQVFEIIKTVNQNESSPPSNLLSSTLLSVVQERSVCWMISKKNKIFLLNRITLAEISWSGCSITVVSLHVQGFKS